MRKRIFFLLFSIELITISCNAYYEYHGDIFPYILNEILYITKTGTPIELEALDGWGASPLVNMYENGLGRIIFFGPVTHIPSRPFKSCISLTSITIPYGVTSIKWDAFSGCTGELVLNCNNCLGLYGGAFTKLVIGDGITYIGEDAFEYCNSLTNVTIGNSVTSIGNGAFRNCEGLTAFYGKFASADNRCLIVYGVLNSFAIGCGLTEYTIPNSVTSIGNSAFYYCSSLTSVTIPDSVTSIGERAFCDCFRLKEVYCKPTTPPTASADMGYWDAFYNNASGRKIYVPRDSVDAYKSAEYWKEYAEDIVGYDF